MNNILPPRFLDARQELDFRREYGRTGHRQSVIGLSIGLSLALVAIALSFLFHDSNSNPIAERILLGIRISIAIALASGLMGLPPRDTAEPFDYLRWIIVPAAFAILALILNYWVAANHGVTSPPAARIFLVSSLALWLFCAFARPTSELASIIAAISSVGAFAAGYMSEGTRMLDTVPYLLIANFSALSVTMQSEKRARALYLRTFELEESRRQLYEKSKRAIRARDFKSKVLTTVSHDLRQPLLGAGLILSSEIRRKDGPNISALHNVSTALQQIETGLQEILRAAAGDIEPDKALEPIDLSKLVAQALSDFHPIASQLGVETHWRNHLPANTLVMSNPAVIRTALSNLLGNAIKFQRNEEHPWVLVRSFLPRSGHVVSLEIIDNGPGINPGSAGEIFEAGYRLPRDRAVPGFGIGLAAVAEQMRELPHHDVILIPRCRKGARFRLTFPIVRTSACATGPER